MKSIEKYVDSKVEEILSSPAYFELDEEDKEELREKISTHLERMIIETFVNRLEEEKAMELNEIFQENPEKGYEKLNQYVSDMPGLSDAIEKRIKNEVEKFKELPKK